MPNIATLMRLAREAEASRVGYDQNQRWTWLDQAGRRIVPDRETDCSALTLGLFWLAGWPVNISGTCYTGNAAELCRRAGFEVKDVRGWSLQALKNTLKAGDALVGPGHIILAMDDGSWLSAENDERGRSAGGRAGDQTGREVRFRAPYQRSKGWVHLLRPHAAAPEPQERSAGAELTVDGQRGPKTTRALQRWVHATPDGIIGRDTIRKLQDRVGARVDGVMGRETITKLQTLLGVYADGQWGPNTNRALQTYFNRERWMLG